MIDSRKRLGKTTVVDRNEALGLTEADLYIGAAGWDMRSTVITGEDRAVFLESLLITYTDAVSAEAEALNEQALVDYLSVKSIRPPDVITLNSSEVEAGWRVIQHMLYAAYSRIGHPLRVVVDLTSIPRFWTMSAMAFLSRTGVGSTITFIYADAVGYDVVRDGDHNHSFTSGEWEPIPVPGLGQIVRSSAQSHLVVSGGFEGAKIRRLVHALEPDRVSLVLASGNQEHEDQSRRANDQLVEQFKLGPLDVLLVPYADLGESLTLIQQLVEKDLGSQEPNPHLSFLLSGPKIVSLAMSIISLDWEVSQVYYPSPERHNRSSASAISTKSAAEVRL